MKTTHEIARDLLALPDVPLLVEGWCEMNNHEVAVKMRDADETGAILFQKVVDVEKEKAFWASAAIDYIRHSIRYGQMPLPVSKS